MAIMEAGRLRMPADIQEAAEKGNRDVLVSAFGLREEQHNDVQITVEQSDPSSQLSIKCATHFGDTVLHILVTNEHNDLAFLGFQKDSSLLKARNNLRETPLHCAAKIGNAEFLRDLIEHAPEEVKDALGETNCNGETASHVAVKHGHIRIFRKLNEWDASTACMEGMPLLQLAILKGYTSVVKALLNYDPTLACSKDKNGSFPVHLAARTSSAKLLIDLVKWYPDVGELLDYKKQNILHIAAEKHMTAVFKELFEMSKNNLSLDKMVSRMIIATDNEGNLPLHIAATNGCHSIMKLISKAKKNTNAHLQRNYKGQTPFELSMMQIKASKDVDKFDQRIIKRYIDEQGPYFKNRWFTRVRFTKDADRLQKIQIVGLGSVLIATVAFAAAFTLPGGYDPVRGTPNQGHNHYFKAFIMADILAFMQSFISIFLIIGSIFFIAGGAFYNQILNTAALCFLSAAISLVMAFGLALYVVLEPVNHSIATLAFYFAAFQGLPTFLIIFGTSAIVGSSILRITRLPALAGGTYLSLVVAGSFLFIFFFARV